MATSYASDILHGQGVESILKEGAGIIQSEVQLMVRTRARYQKAKRTGQLEASITYELHPERGEAALGWKKIPISDGKGGRRVSGYTDVRGRRRKITTVADYGRLLEYSQRRQLRHMEEGFIDAEDRAVAAMEAMADSLLERAADAAIQQAGL